MGKRKLCKVVRTHRNKLLKVVEKKYNKINSGSNNFIGIF